MSVILFIVLYLAILWSGLFYLTSFKRKWVKVLLLLILPLSWILHIAIIHILRMDEKLADLSDLSAVFIMGSIWVLTLFDLMFSLDKVSSSKDRLFFILKIGMGIVVSFLIIFNAIE
jgi:hypothetical protein